MYCMYSHPIFAALSMSPFLYYHEAFILLVNRSVCVFCGVGVLTAPCAFIFSVFLLVRPDLVVFIAGSGAVEGGGGGGDSERRDGEGGGSACPSNSRASSITASLAYRECIAPACTRLMDGVYEESWLGSRRRWMGGVNRESQGAEV